MRQTWILPASLAALLLVAPACAGVRFRQVMPFRAWMVMGCLLYSIIVIIQEPQPQFRQSVISPWVYAFSSSLNGIRKPCVVFPTSVSTTMLFTFFPTRLM